MDWSVFFAGIFIVLMGGWTIYDAVDNFKKRSYFWFGVRVFVCIYWATLLVRLQLL